MAGETYNLYISGTTLSSIIQRFSSAPYDLNGLLFGKIQRLPPPLPSDDDGGANVDAGAAIAISITGHLAVPISGAGVPFSDALGRVDPQTLGRLSSDAGGDLIGWFSGRRGSTLRPSMRERAVSIAMSKTLTLDSSRSAVFLLLSSSETPNRAVHTHEYRAFVVRTRTDGGSVAAALEPRNLNVVNVGTGFREHYSLFSPDSAMPWVPYRPRSEGEGEGGSRSKKGESLGGIWSSPNQQRLLDLSQEGFGAERLERMVGQGATAYTSELEDMYGKMLIKLENLARLVEESSAKVLEQEKHNSLLRNKIAGSE